MGIAKTPEIEEEGSIASKKEEPNFFQNLSFYLTEYCENTSIHGFKFFGERGRYLIEKLWWLVFVSASLYYCSTLIRQTYMKWMEAPVIVSFATSETPLWRIPFPAVTICPLIKTEKYKFSFEAVLDLKENNTDYDEETAVKFQYISLVCPKTFDDMLDENSTDTVDSGVNKFLMEVSPAFNSTIYKCRWLGKACTPSVDTAFTPVLTSEGVCYSFNILDYDDIFTSTTDLHYYKNLSITHQPPSEWTLDDGYSDKSNLDAFPRRTIITGVTGGLDLIFYTAAEDIDYKCGDSLKGYKVILHHPAEIPRSHQNYFWVPLNQFVTAAVKPNMITTSSKLQGYDPDDRKCCFASERRLKYFKLYNQQNCLLECSANFAKRRCDCVGFYMPRDKSTPICGPAKAQCLEDANVAFLTREATFQMRTAEEQKTKGSKAKKIKTECNCLPSCHTLHYDAETSQLDWDWREGQLFTDLDNTTAHLSRVRIFFKDLQFMTSKRSELYGQTEFWANCGGLLGLFTGFSFISAVEVVYFATLRFVCNVKKYGWGYWSGARELLATKDS